MSKVKLEGTQSEVQASTTKRSHPIVDFLKRLVREKPLGTIGGIIILVVFFVGVFADGLAPYGINEISLAERLSGPSTMHLLGTDALGRDLFSRIIYGCRISMYVGLGASAISICISIVIGTISGFFGGRLDMIIQRFVDAIMSFPWLVLVLTIMALLGPGMIQVILVLGFSNGIRSSRVIRSAVIAIKENLYVVAGKALGASSARILIRHILPNIMAPIIVVFTVFVGQAILGEATISFLGLGIPPPTPSWGGMLSRAGREHMLKAPRLALWPGLALAFVVYGINMLGDAVRDILDPRLRGGLGRYGTTKGAKLERLHTKGKSKQNDSRSSTTIGEY